jgi:hypothetical protein
MLRKALMIVMAAAALAVFSLAQQAPDLSGTWKLNNEKSDFGQMPGPVSRTDVIEQRGSSVSESVVSEGQNGKREYTLTFMADGKEKQFEPDASPQVGRATLQSILATWQRNILVVNEVLDFQGNDVAEMDSYSLSPDGNVLTINIETKSARGNRTRRLVFERSDGTAAAAAPAPAIAPVMAATTVAHSIPRAAAPVAATAPTTPATPAAPGPKPNLTGVWKLNIEKSEFGQFPTPDGRIDRITDDEPSVKIEVAQTGGIMGGMEFTMDLSADGKETTSTMFGNNVKHTAHWDGNALVVDSKMESQEGNIQFTSTYTLGEGGKSLGVATHFSGPQGDSDMKMVFDKQP